MSDIKSPQYDALARELQYSARLYQWAELKTNPEFPPPSPGLYGWFFKCVPLPPKVPIDSCIVREGATLLYIGISPNNDKSTGDLRKRVRLHFNVTAEFSTLRLTLGCLLVDKLGTELLQDVSGGKTFGEKERVLSEWMAVNSIDCMGRDTETMVPRTAYSQDGRKAFAAEH
jgi:hypothetical protein